MPSTCGDDEHAPTHSRIPWIGKFRNFLITISIVQCSFHGIFIGAELMRGNESASNRYSPRVGFVCSKGSSANTTFQFILFRTSRRLGKCIGAQMTFTIDRPQLFIHFALMTSTPVRHAKRKGRLVNCIRKRKFICIVLYLHFVNSAIARCWMSSDGPARFNACVCFCHLRSLLSRSSD